MTKFEVLKEVVDVNFFADLIVGFAKKFETSQAIAAELETEISEESVQLIESLSEIVSSESNGKQYVINQKKKKVALAEEIDATIDAICKKIIKEDVCPGEYAEIIKALASLIEARAAIN